MAVSRPKPGDTYYPCGAVEYSVIDYEDASTEETETSLPQNNAQISLPKDPPWWLILLLGVGGGATGGFGLAGIPDKSTSEHRIEALESEMDDLNSEMDTLSSDIRQLLIGQAVLCQAEGVDCHPAPPQ